MSDEGDCGDGSGRGNGRDEAGGAARSNTLFVNRRVQLVTLAAHHRVPTIYPYRAFVESGGLMSYAPPSTDPNRQAGIYVGRILKGEKPTDLPVMRPTKFEFVINLQTAGLLGITIPPTLYALADEVISTASLLLDRLVSAQQNRWGYRKTERRGGLAVYDHLVFHRKLHREIARLLAAQNAIDIGGGTTKVV